MTCGIFIDLLTHNTKTMDKLFIIRGIPGSGKSTLAKNLVGRHFREADMFFTDVQGNYNFDAARIKDAHRWCQSEIEDLMLSGRDNIAVSNTFTRKWEYEPYLALAKKYGYDVEIIICKGKYKNVHGVPPHVVKAMKDRFEY